MKRLSAKITAVIAVIALLVSLIPSVTATEKTSDNDLLFGRKQLLKMENGEALAEAYDRVVKGIENKEKKIYIDDLYISEDELLCLLSAYMNDPHPHFWNSNSYSYSMSSRNRIISLTPIYNHLAGETDEEFQENVAAFNKAVTKLIRDANISDNMSDYEKELRIHDTLVKQLTYKNGTNAHNIYGAIVEKSAVCQGYAYAFNYLLRLCGIEAHYVTGISKKMSHGWSLVCIDGHYYYTDITWDDPIGNDDSNDVYHAYFNVNDNILGEDHDWEPPVYGLPDCTDKDENFFEHNPEHIVNGEPDVGAIADLFKNGIAYIYVSEDCDFNIVGWYFENAAEIALLAGYDMTESVSAGISYMGREYHLTMDGKLIEEIVEKILGDLDGDGKLNSIDSNIMKRVLSGGMAASEIQPDACDVNEDGHFDSRDSNILKRLIAGS